MSNKRFNIKKLITVSAAALTMISVGGVASTVNSNTNVHADSGFQEEMANLKYGNNAMEKRGNQDETHAEIAGDRSDPNALAEDVDYNYSFVKHHKSQLFKDLPKSVINYAKLNRESMEKNGSSTPYTYDDYVKSLKAYKNKRLHKVHKHHKHVSHKHKVIKRAKSHKKRITKHHKANKRINRKRNRKNHKYIKRSHRIDRHYKRNRK